MGTKVPVYRWAKEIKNLDENKCVFCGSVMNLEAHHIKEKAKFPQLSTDLENGITLCRQCHRTAHGAYLVPYRGTRPKPRDLQAFIFDYAECKIVISLSKEKLASIKAHAERRGESVNGFINRAIDETIARDKAE
jgi:ferredoxin